MILPGEFWVDGLELELAPESAAREADRNASDGDALAPLDILILFLIGMSIQSFSLAHRMSPYCTGKEKGI